MSLTLTSAAHRGERPLTRSVTATPGRPTVVLGVLGALLLGLLAWTFLAPGDGLEKGGRYPGTAPAEWSPTSTWATPALLPETRPTPVGEDRVAVLTDARRILLVDAAAGRIAWRGALPEGRVVLPPFPTHIDGEDVVAAHVGTQLVWWRLEDGTPERLDIPADAVVVPDGEVPLVVMHDGHAQAVTTDSPTTVTIPENARALAAHADGTITAAGPTGWWHLGRDGAVTSSGAWENTAPVTPTVVGYTGGSILLVRPGATTDVEVHVDRATDVRFAFSGPIVLPGGVGGSLTWTPSPSRTWGVLGRALVDLRGARVQDLGAWSTTTVTADRAYGHIDGQKVVVGPDLPRGVVPPAEATPDVVLRAGAVVRSGGVDGPPGRGGDADTTPDTAHFLPPRKATP